MRLELRTIVKVCKYCATLKTMSLPTIGRVVSPHEQAAPEVDGIVFTVPYGSRSYDIGFSNDDMQTLLARQCQKVIGTLATRFGNFDYVIELPSPELNLWAVTQDLTVTPTGHGNHVIDLNVGIVTKSVVNEHRGIVRAHKDPWSEWQLAEYVVQPPLKSPPYLQT